MQKSLMDILACPICKDHPLVLQIFYEEMGIVEGLIICKKCKRWYPIIDEIPHMLPDELREKINDFSFLMKWKDKIPEETLEIGKPINLKTTISWSCPICSKHSSKIHFFDNFGSGILICENCSRWFPIIKGWPHLVMDDKRSITNDYNFIMEWKDKIPNKTLSKGKPYNLETIRDFL